MSTKSIIKPLVVAFGATALAGATGSVIWKEEHRPSVLEVHVFSLQNGRSMFIRTPDDKRVIVDGGSNSEVIREISKILPFYSRRIDLVIATDSEAKNITGLIDIVSRYKIDRAYVPAFTVESLGLADPKDDIYSVFLKKLEDEGVKIEEVMAGRIINLDSKVSLKIYFPAKPESFSYSKTSAPEILFSINFGKNNISFLGSATNKVQKHVASNVSTRLNTDALIVSHSALPVNISKELVASLNPHNLIYSKKVRSTDQIKVASKSEKPEIKDPLVGLPEENKFNLQEKGMIKIVLDGLKTTIIHGL